MRVQATGNGMESNIATYTWAVATNTDNTVTSELESTVTQPENAPSTTLADTGISPMTGAFAVLGGGLVILGCGFLARRSR